MVNQLKNIKNADALVIRTEWSIFRIPDFNKSAIIDGMYLYDVKDMKTAGFYYG